MFGTAGLPHILMRFFTVPNAKEIPKVAEKVVRRMNLDWQIAGVSPGLDVRIDEFSMNAALPGVKIDVTGNPVDPPPAA